MGIALSNLNGIDHRIKAFDGAESAEPNSAFVYTRFQDRLTLELDESSDQRSLWERISVAARATSGAFPLAFRPVHLTRSRAEPDYNDQAIHLHYLRTSPKMRISTPMEGGIQ